GLDQSGLIPGLVIRLSQLGPAERRRAGREYLRQRGRLPGPDVNDTLQVGVGNSDNLRGEIVDVDIISSKAAKGRASRLTAGKSFEHSWDQATGAIARAVNEEHPGPG